MLALVLAESTGGNVTQQSAEQPQYPHWHPVFLHPVFLDLVAVWDGN